MKKLFILLISSAALIGACDNEPTKGDPVESTEEEEIKTTQFTSTISGAVVLENQQHHSNALIYLAGIERGVSSDAFGHYEIQFGDSDSVFTGDFTLYYFLEDYDLDSAFIWMQDGMVKLDTMDVDSSGNLPLKELRQILRVQGWTDKVEYQRGESILVSMRFTNISDRTLHFRIGNTYTNIGNFYLVRGGGNYTFSFFPEDIVPAEFNALLSPGEFHEGQVDDMIPEGKYILQTYVPLPLTEYVVATSFNLYNREKTLPEELRRSRRFIWFYNNNWYNLHSGPLPRFDLVPNKFELAVISIIE